MLAGSTPRCRGTPRANVLANLAASTARGQRVLRQLTEAVRNAGFLLFRPQPDAGSAASFLLLACRTGRAQDWVEKASAGGVTLRRCWPAYQVIQGLRASTDLAWLGGHLLVLEIHPWLTTGEVEQIARTLGKLASWNGSKKDGELGPKNSGEPTASRDPIEQ